MYVRMYIFTYVCTYARMYASTYVGIYVCVLFCMSVCKVYNVMRYDVMYPLCSSDTSKSCSNLPSSLRF